MMARLIYISFLLVWTLASFVLLIPGLKTRLLENKVFKDSFRCDSSLDAWTCSELVSYEIIHRLFLVIAFYHFVLAFALIPSNPSCVPFREYLHNRGWIVKILILAALVIASWYIPQQSQFIQYFSYIALIGAVLFVFFQFYLYLDLAEFVVAFVIRARDLERETNKHKTSTKVITVLIILKSFELFGVSFGVVSFVLVTTSTGDCIWNDLFIILNLGACFIAFGISLHPRIRSNLSPAVVFLPCAVITFHSIFVTCFALSSQVDKKCYLDGTFLSATNLPIGLNPRAIIACFLMLIALFYEGMRSYKDSYVLGLLSGGNFENETFKESHDEKSEDAEKTSEPSYSYPAFHFLMLTSSLYMLMTITNWYGPVLNRFPGQAGVSGLEAHWRRAQIGTTLASCLPVVLYIGFMIRAIAKDRPSTVQTQNRTDKYTAIPLDNKTNEHGILDSPDSGAYKENIADTNNSNIDENIDLSAACNMLRTGFGKLDRKCEVHKRDDDELVIKCRKIRDTAVNFYHFPQTICQSYYGGRNGSNACTIIAVLIARAFFLHDVQPQQTGRLAEHWINLFSSCIAEGNKMYDVLVSSRQQGVLDLSVEDVVEEFGSTLQIKRLGSSLPVSFVSETETATVYFQLERLRQRNERQAVIFIKDYRSGVFLFTKEGLLLYADSHPYGSGGAVLICAPDVNEVVLLLMEILRVVSLEGLGSLTPVYFHDS